MADSERQFCASENFLSSPCASELSQHFPVHMSLVDISVVHSEALTAGIQFDFLPKTRNTQTLTSIIHLYNYVLEGAKIAAGGVPNR